MNGQIWDSNLSFIYFFYKAIVFSLRNIQNPVRKYKPVWYFTRRELIALGIEELKDQTEYGEAAQAESDTSKTWLPLPLSRRI